MRFRRHLDRTRFNYCSVTGWTATLINPTYALATGPTFDSSLRGNFNFTTCATDRTGTAPFVFDWILSHGRHHRRI